MGILRADIVSHSQLEPTGSVAFDGTTDYLTIPASGAWFSGAANSTVKKSFTVEWWQYWNAVSGYVDLLDVNYNSGLLIEANAGKYSVNMPGNSAITEATAAVTGQWYHYALVFYAGDGISLGSAILYRDGEVSASGKVDGNVAVGNASTAISIGAKQSNGAYSLNGYISNFRWCDRAVYNASFTPPKFELTAIAGTQLLCCQSSSSATEAAVIPGGLSITAAGNAAASAFAPDLKKDITDAGVVLEDNTKFDTLSYMVPPGGTTTQSNRGRGLAAGGYTPGVTDQIYSVEIASDGMTNDFGNLTLARRGTAAVSSSTRAVWAGGYAPGYQDRIDYVTIATSANAIDFGNLDHGRFESSGVSNGIRGVFGPCENPAQAQNVIQYITIATTGNATDFGDSSISTGTKKQASMTSTTRGLFAGGQNVPSPSAYYDVIQYITIASTGNAQDFGDLTQTVHMTSGVSSSTRGVRAGGQVDPSQTNTDTIDFVTIASTGNATDFGNLSTSNQRSSAMSNSIRGLFSGGGAPNSSTQINTVDKITIASTGNATDWGDYFGTKVTQAAGCSDSHGGLS